MRIELKIIDLLSRNQEKRFTIREIAKAIDEFYSFVHRTVKKLIDEEVIKTEKAGKAFLCELNLNNEKTRALLVLSEIEKKEAFFGDNKELAIILKDIPVNQGDSIILFGSYAKGTANEDSDIDILIIGKTQIRAKEIYAKYGKEINAIVMSPEDFRKKRDKVFIGEVLSSHIVLNRAESFVSLAYDTKGNTPKLN